MTYTVIGIFSVTVTQEIEADSPDEAAERFDESPDLCHQCARVVSVGDTVPECIEVLDESGELVWTAEDGDLTEET